jgi:hypothetical protein
MVPVRKAGERSYSQVESAAVRIMGIPLSRASVLLFTLCLLDTVSSALLFHNNLAVEANPLLAGAADAGVLPFVALKTLSFLPALVAAEWYRRYRPQFVRVLLCGASAIYVGIYAFLVGAQFAG